MDKIFIEDLRVDAIIGIYDWEREVPQELVLNVEAAFDIAAAAKSKDINQSLDYAEIAARLRRLIVDNQYLLVETLVEDSANMILREFPVPWVKIRCKKTQVMSEAGGVGVEIVRGSSSMDAWGKL